jgi:serine/threonine protein kinase
LVAEPKELDVEPEPSDAANDPKQASDHAADSSIGSTSHPSGEPTAADPEAQLLDAPTHSATAPAGDSIAPSTKRALPSDLVILDELGRGATGIVYRARQVKLSRQVAIKMLHGDAATDPKWMMRLRAEAAAVARLDHPSIVPVYDVAEAEHHPYMVMALVEGKSLSRLLADGPMTPRRSAMLAWQISDAIAHAHQNGVVHRDIKPANILIDNDDAIHLTDFGVARVHESGHPTLSDGINCIGTPQYMPPEQARSDREAIGPASDVYSIGAVLYTMLTSRPPFQAAHPAEVIAQVISVDPLPPRRLVRSIPSDLQSIVLKSLEKLPAHRYASAAELRDDLQRFLDGKPVRAGRFSLLRQLRSWYRQNFVVAGISGSAAMLLMVLVFVLFYAWQTTRHRLLDIQRQLEETQSSNRVER